jgi:glutamate racemase
MNDSTTQKANLPVGVFDSGVGGLTVAREIFRLLPGEDVVYFGDQGRTPYGGRSKEIIIQFTRQDVAFLNEHNVKHIVCACNSASSTALDEVSKDSPVPMTGVIEPGAAAAVRRTTNGRVGIIGTNATIGSDAYAKLIQAQDAAVKVFSMACPLFVPLAEEGYIDKEATRLIAREYLQSMLDVEVDTLVLGCTHYPLIKNIIAEVMGDKVTLIDSGEETAKVVKDKLTEAKLLSSKKTGTHKFFVSDVPERFSKVASRFMGRLIDNITRIDISRY